MNRCSALRILRCKITLIFLNTQFYSAEIQEICFSMGKSPPPAGQFGAGCNPELAVFFERLTLNDERLTLNEEGLTRNVERLKIND